MGYKYMNFGYGKVCSACVVFLDDPHQYRPKHCRRMDCRIRAKPGNLRDRLTYQSVLATGQTSILPTDTFLRGVSVRDMPLSG